MSESTEYMRRNLLLMDAQEANKRAQDAVKRLQRMKRQPKWLVRAVSAIADRTAPLSADLTEYRDLVGDQVKQPHEESPDPDPAKLIFDRDSWLQCK